MGDARLAKSYDILIIGAGPAGSTAAQAAAERGAKVLLIDRRHRIGVPVQCAEFVPQGISRYVRFSSKCILQVIETLTTHLPDQRSLQMRSPGYVLDRSLFDKELATSAVLSGARLSTETIAADLSPEGVIVERGTKEEVIQSKVIIGADGVHSSVARWAGLPPPKTIVALQYEVVIPHSQNDVEIFFHKNYAGGYAWFFPKGRTANVGVGIIPQKASLLPNLLNDFIDRLVDLKRLSGMDVVGKTGGSIPCEHPCQTVFGNTLLVGDAASHAHPITGGGILTAVIGGEIAGRIAAEATDRGDLEYLRNYEMEWRETFGRSLSYGAWKREMLEEGWNRPAVNFEDLIQKTWVGFKDYYGERRGGRWNRE